MFLEAKSIRARISLTAFGFRNTVVAKGLLNGGEQQPSVQEEDTRRSRERIAGTAGEMADQVADLQRRLGNTSEDPVPYVVGGVTRMQELLDDLLAYSRYAGSAEGLEATLNAAALNVSHVE